MQTHKEKANYKRKLESSREYLHHMYADEKVNDKAKAAFNRPLFGIGGKKDERKTES